MLYGVGSIRVRISDAVLSAETRPPPLLGCIQEMREERECVCMSVSECVCVCV